MYKTQATRIAALSYQCRKEKASLSGWAIASKIAALPQNRKQTQGKAGQNLDHFIEAEASNFQ